jgi:hypothetical protein
MSYNMKEFPMLATGMPITTCSNTIVTLFSSLWAFCATMDDVHFDVNELSKNYAFLGLSAKIKLFSRPSQADFLKGHFVEQMRGAWLDGESLWMWYPGLGTLSKFGFSKNDLRTMREYQNMSKYDAEFSFLSDVALGWSSFMNGPLIRVFSKVFNKPRVKKERTYGVVGSNSGRDAANYDFSDYFAYYGVDEREFTEFEEKLELLPLGYVIDDPVLAKFVRDYQ